MKEELKSTAMQDWYKIKLDNSEFSDDVKKRISEILTEKNIPALEINEYYSPISEANSRYAWEWCPEGFVECFVLDIQRHNDSNYIDIRFSYYMDEERKMKFSTWKLMKASEEDKAYYKTLEDSVKNFYKNLKDFLGINNYYKHNRTFIKKQDYKILSTIATATGDRITIKTKDYGKIDFERYGSVMELYDKLGEFIHNDSLEKSKNAVLKKLNLNISYIQIVTYRTEIDIRVYDKDGKQKVLSGYMKIYGKDFFKTFSDKFLNNPEYYTEEHGSGYLIIKVLDAFSTKRIKKIDDQYRLHLNASKSLDLENFEGLKEKYINLVGEDEAAADLLLIELEAK